jgi:hypothetical protein
MTGTAVVRALGAEFNAFLYAPIGEEGNGMTLSVVSALARQNIDPWAHATYLSNLPWQSAVRDLASMIAALPAGPEPRPPPDAIATRLIALLPKRAGARPRRALPWYSRTVNPSARPIKGSILFAYLCSLLISLWIIAALHRPPPIDKAPIPSPSGAQIAHRPTDARVAMTQQTSCGAHRPCRGAGSDGARASTATAR